MIENSHITNDSFATNDDSNDITSNVASFIADAGYNSSGGSLFHSSYVSAVSSAQLSISDYLARPKLMYSGTITDYITAPAVFDFAFDYLSSPDIHEKLKYIHLLRGTFQIKLIVTSGPYNTGRLGMSSMYGTIGEYGAVILDTPTLVASLQSKTNTVLDLGSTNSAVLSIPLHLRTPYVTNSSPDAAELEKMKLYLYTVNTIRNSNSLATSILYWKIYVSFVSADTVIPVPFSGVYEHTSEISQTADGVISAPASIVSNVAHSLKDVPIIGPFALATSIGASAISNIARLFGFSRPRDQSKPAFPHSVYLASGIGEVRAKNLTLDPKQEVTIDSSFLGENGDALSYQNTICRRGLVSVFDWTQIETPGTLVHLLPISPAFSFAKDVSTVWYFAPSPLAYCSQLFNGWRGSIDVHISIPANKFVRGKMRVYWTPTYITSAPSLSTISNNSLSVLIDLTQTIDMTITVPWLSNNMYLPVGTLFNEVSSVSADQNKWSNGYLAFVVEEQLITNNSAWAADFIVYYSAGSDLELVYPSQQSIANTTFGLVDPTLAPAFYNPGNIILTLTGADTPLLDSWKEYTADSNAVNPAMSTSINLSPGDTNDKAALIHIGENIPSLRLLLKRFYPLASFPNYTTTVNDMHGPFLPYLPPSSIGQISGATTLYPPYLNNPVTYLAKMFGGMRGSVRYFLSMSSTRDYFVGRFYGEQGRSYRIPDSVNTLRILNEHLPGGLTSYKTQGEPVVVDIPYQNYHWFYPTANVPTNTTTLSYGALALTAPNANTSSQPHHLYYSTGEDFQFVLYNGPPIICKVPP